jgi:hypothetical protein
MATIAKKSTGVSYPRRDHGAIQWHGIGRGRSHLPCSCAFWLKRVSHGVRDKVGFFKRGWLQIGRKISNWCSRTAALKKKLSGRMQVGFASV